MRGLRGQTLLLAAVAAVIALVPQNVGPPRPGAEPSFAAAEPTVDPSPYRSAAAAMRRGDFEAASVSIADLRSAEPEREDEARIILGLYAAETGRHELSAELLASPGGLFEDYRLLSLAESRAAAGEIRGALEAFSELVQGDAPTPIRAHAIVRAVEAARDEKPLDALRFVQISRSIDLPSEEHRDLEKTAWEIAGDLELDPARREIARQLLTHFPLVASKVEAIELFRGPEGLDWTAILPTHQLFARSESLLAADLPDAARLALDEIPTPDRDLRWSILKARALTETRLGDAALAVLQAAAPATAAERAQVAWHRAEAALEVATARRDKTLTSETRLAMRSAARRYLWDTVRAAGDDELTARALRVLHAELMEDELFEEAVGVLARLRAIDPSDNTGAEHLWESGWQEYSQRNPSSAIGYWSQLRELYPEHSRSRSALYWTGRAHDKLGNRARAEAIYREVVAWPAKDFYSRYAIGRLPDDAPVGSTGAPPDVEQFWPVDAALRRAETLYELGLDRFALLEMDSVAEIADRRALNGLRATVLASQGRRRDSIRAVWRAFPALGRVAQNGVPDRAKRLYYPLAFEDLIRQNAARRGLPIDIVFAMIRQESAFDAGAHSWAGAHGLMQVMPATGRELARRLGIPYSAERLKDPGTSVLLGTEYFHQVLEMFDGNVELALAGYNGGPYRIKRLWREAPPGTEIDAFLEGLAIAETRTYVKRILLFSDSYDRLYFRNS